jgi:tetratricopeptide (TPR) repeat protein
MNGMTVLITKNLQPLALALAAVCFLALGCGAQQSAEMTTLDSRVAELRSQLADTSLALRAKQAAYGDLSATLDRIGELRFEGREFDAATKAFVDAGEALKKYHETRYAVAQADLKDAEQKLAGFIADQNQPNRELLIATYRDTLVRNALTTALSEAQHLGDVEAQKKYLTRLNELAADNADPARQAEYFEKSGQLEFEAGNNDRAFECWDEALHLRQKAGKDEYWTLDHIARARSYLGEFDKALEAYGRIVEISRSLSSQPVTFKPDASVTLRQSIWMEHGLYQMTLAQALLDTSQIQQMRGSYGAARSSVDEAGRIVDQMSTDTGRAEEGTRDVLTTMTETMRANHLRSRGRLSEARGDEAAAVKDYADAIAIYSGLGKVSASGTVAWLRTRAALILSRQGKFDEARANIREAMAIRGRLHQQSGTTVALMQASRIELADKKVDDALRLAGEAKSSAAIVGLDDIMAEADEVEADALFAKAGTSTRMLDSAIRGYESAAKTFRQLDLRPMLIRVQNSLGVAYEKAGRPKDAEAAYKDAANVAEAVKTSFSTGEESSSYANRGDVTDIYRHLVDLLVSQGRAEEALQYATRAQRRDLIDAVPKREIKSNAVQQVNAAAEREEAARTNLSNVRGASLPAGTTVQKSLATALGAARQDYALAIKRLETEQPNLRFTVRPTDLLKLQSSIAPTEAIVSYLVTADKLYIFVVRRNAVAVRAVNISQNDLRGLIAQAREAIKGFGDDFYEISGDPDEAFAKEKISADVRSDDGSEHYNKLLAPAKRSLAALDEKLIAPIDDLVGDAATLKIIPNAELFLLPFSALISKDNRYLVERHELMFLTAGDLISSPVRSLPATQMIAFGDPTEANLDGALDEVKAIQKVFPRLQLFTEDKATKEQLFQLKSAKIVHFATHGHIRAPLESSAIQLAHLPNLASPDLSYGEIYALPLKSSDMIVLSACETALGGVSGTEVGVFVEAFRTKTSTVAASLWSVDDLATRELMVEFYKQLAGGQTRSSAMRTAQLKLLHDGRTKNPLFWAAFVLYGEGGRLSGMQPSRAARTN